MTDELQTTMPKKPTRYLLISIVLIGLLFLFSVPSAAQVVEVVVEEPQLQPPYKNDCPDSYWYPVDNNRGHTAYLTLNVNNPYNSTNHGEWHPVISQSGYYRVEAYIVAHPPITWCTGQSRIIPHDTTETRYSIHHANGVTNRLVSQYPLSNQWLDLGEYYFNAGQSGYVYLADLNGETDFSTTISFSAMRFTFTRLTRPKIYLPLVQYTDPSGQPPPDVGVIQDQGFDACHLPEISEMQTWWNQSPYSFYALYIGGISLYHECAIANSTWIKAVHQQGWSFVPTWVGPQAPCSQWIHKMSSDPSVAYQEGRQEAQAASAAAASIGLTNNGLGGTVIYYDMETFGGASLECRQTASSFINGWVERLHELGNIAGGYGSRNSYVGDWPAIDHVPDEIWAASWYTNTYDADASVYGISWLQGLWINHQRIRQYAGSHNENWGGKSFNIDSNVADGLVAMPSTKPLSIPIVTSSPTIEDAGWLSADQGWLVSTNRLYWTSDHGKNWQDISPAPVQVAYVLPSGEAWALSTQDSEQASLYHSTDWGENWESIELDIPPDNWRPLQLRFSSQSNGWVVMQKKTSQAFDYGMLMKTSDGGASWHSYEIPTASPIQFVSQAEGWLINRTSGALYHTVDSGLTWQPTRYDRYPMSKPALPEGTSFSGWQTDELGWATTTTGNCSGEKSKPGFVCQIETSLWQTLDGGQTWQSISIPKPHLIKP
jgi:hypothetical protein